MTCPLFSQLLEAEQQAAQLEEKVRELEATLEKTRSQLQEKDAQLEEQKRRERDLLKTITEYVQDVSVPPGAGELCAHFSENA